MKTNLLRYALTKTLPVFCGYLFLGIAFGLLLSDAGYGFGWALFTSTVIYAGSMQFMLVQFLTGGTGLLTVALMTLLINGRHLFYGLTFLEKFKRMGKRCFYMIFSLTDETYSLLCSLTPPPEYEESDLFYSIARLDHAYWIFGSVLGALIGQVIPFDTAGIDFAMTALFVVIFVEQWMSFPTRLPAVIGAVSAVCCLVLFGPSSFLLPSLFLTVAALLLLRRRLEPHILTNEEESKL